MYDIAKQNEEKFYQAAEALEIDKAEALYYYERFCEDNVFQDGTGVLTSLWMETGRMKLPSETYDDDSGEIYIEITQESQENMYSTYCPYLDDTIEFKYLCGEGGNVHCVGIAKRLILWKQDGNIYSKRH